MYQLFRSRSDSALYLICREGEFEGLPEAVRLRGPWDIKRRGQVLRLRTDNRSRIDRFGYVLEVSKTPLRPERYRGA